jgi:hypothetical protein
MPIRFSIRISIGRTSRDRRSCRRKSQLKSQPDWYKALGPGVSMANGEADATSISLCLWSGIDRGTEPAEMCSADNLKWHMFFRNLVAVCPDMLCSTISGCMILSALQLECDLASCSIQSAA